MSISIVAAPSVEPVSLAEARAQCRIDGTDEDDLLSIYIAAAREAAEHRTNRRFITQTWLQTLDEFPVTSDIKLLVPPVASVTSVTYVDPEGTTQTLASTAYVLDANAQPAGWLLPADGTEWPDTDDVINAVQITLVCGYGASGSSVPTALRNWMLMTIGYLYAQREAIDGTGRHKEIPSRFVDGLLDPFIVYGL